MDLLTTLQIAWRSLMVNKMRSVLTALGIIIGVAAVIVMVSLSQGATAGITERISSMGSNLLMVTPGGNFGPVRGTSVGQLTILDAQAIANLPLVERVAPEASSNNATLTAGSSTWTASLSGTLPALQDIKKWPTSEGEFFNDYDVENGAMVAVVGQTVVDNLFPNGQSALGKSIKINGLPFTVIGVLSVRGAGGMGDNQDNTIYIPLTTAQQRLMGANSIRVINVQAVSEAALTPLQDSITSLLRQRHRLSDNREDDFRIQDMTQVLSTIEDTTQILTFLLGGIAGISLLVGGIGIMNIMLVSVTERTREIGIRMAVGATTNDILTQFLIEALLLSVIGGVIGITLGWGGTQVLSALAGFRMALVPWLVAVAIGFSMMVGLFFGYYPARKAANSNPIEALRFE
ncbi:MAG: FtsX-like permease family protein [Firmicutes bacterium]|nr:FtsX-like permease family protein [Bacillota bacterium]